MPPLQAQPQVAVPQLSGEPLLIDGRFGEREWRGAATLAINDSTMLVAMQRDGHVYLGVRFLTPNRSYIDLFLQNNETLYNLHASAQIGERLLRDTTWTDSEPAWAWGNHVDWIANEVKTNPTMPRSDPWTERIFPYEGFEFQLRRSRFNAGTWLVRVEVRDFMGESPDLVFPGSSTRKNIARWLRVRLE